MYKNRTILHVDDDPTLLQVVAHQLEGGGYEVISLAEPTRALDVLLEIDARLVLLDVDMPDMDGLQLLRAIKRQDGGVQVIMLTGMTSMSTVLQSMRWGAEACLFKPQGDFEPLLEAVKAAHDKLDRWWHSLEELQQRKSSEQSIAAPAS